MTAAMWTKLLFIFSKPFLIFDGVSTVAAIFAPNDHPLTETALANDAKLVTFAVALGDGFLAPTTSNIVCGIAFSDISQDLTACHHDGIGCHLVKVEVVK